MTTVLIVAEHDGTDLNPSTAKCVACAAELDGAEIDIAVLGEGVAGVAAAAAEINGVRRVVTVDRDENHPALAAVLAPQVAAIAGDYSHVFGPSTAFGKDVMPRVAALLGVNQVSDIMTVEGDYRFKRPIYAGNAVVTVSAPPDQKLVATVRTASYQAAAGGHSPPGNP